MMTEHHSAGFGETLRRRREQLGLSLDDVAVRTRVRKTYLQALEDENLTVLPGAAYAIGFLRIYARHLEINVVPLLAALRGTADLGHEQFSREGDIPQRGKPRQGKSWRFLLLFLFLVLVLGAAGYLFYSKNQLVSPLKAPAAPRVVAPPAPPAPIPALPQSQSPPPASGTDAVPAADVVALKVLPPEGAIVRIAATAAGVVKVTLDGQESRDYELQPDQQLNWKVGSQLQLLLSAPAQIRCWVNDQEVPLAENVAFRLVAVTAGPPPRQ